jgi:hypothetical protein
LTEGLLKQIQEIRNNQYCEKDIAKLPDWFRDMMPSYYVEYYGFGRAWEMWLEWISKNGVRAFREHRRRQGWVVDPERLEHRRKVASMTPADFLKASMESFRQALDTREDTKNLSAERKEEIVAARLANEQRMMGVLQERRELLEGPDGEKIKAEMEVKKKAELQRIVDNMELDRLRQEKREWVNYPSHKGRGL